MACAVTTVHLMLATGHEESDELRVIPHKLR